MDAIYPGNGACELCGQVDPCDMCVGVSTVLRVPQKLTKDFSDKKNSKKGSGKDPK